MDILSRIAVVPDDVLAVLIAVGALLGLAIAALWFWPRLNRTRTELLQSDNARAHSEDALQRSNTDLAAAETQLGELQAALAAARDRLARLETAQVEQQRATEARIAELKAAKDEFRKDFQVLANNIFDEKSKAFGERSEAQLGQLLKPLREQIGEFKKQVSDAYGSEAQQRAVLKSEIDRLAKLNERLGEDALNLTRALKGQSKTQGNWGEMILARVLEASGLEAGREYETQVKVDGAGGERLFPDAIVRLPGERGIVIDSKVSLVAHERYISADDDAERAQALKDHVTSLRTHIRSLADKAYHDAPGVRSLDFTVLFVPNEPAYMEALQAEPALFREALDAGIGLASPTTLLAILRVVENLWATDKRNKNAEEIARQAGGLYDKFAGFAEDLDKIGTHLDRAGKSYEDARSKLTSGRGNLLNRVESLKKLGAKSAKSLPAGFEADEAGEVTE